MRVYLINDKELEELVEKIELLTLQAKEQDKNYWAPMERLHRSIHYHVVGWVQQVKKGATK